LTDASANSCRASPRERKPGSPSLWISQPLDSENWLIPSPVHAGRKCPYPMRLSMTRGNVRPEKNTGRATRQAHMARRNGTACLSASISSSAHYQPTIGRLHNNHYVSYMANRLSFKFRTNRDLLRSYPSKPAGLRNRSANWTAKVSTQVLAFRNPTGGSRWIVQSRPTGR